MGNETSSVKIHSLLSAEDIKRLRAGFPVSDYLFIKEMFLCLLFLMEFTICLKNILNGFHVLGWWCRDTEPSKSRMGTLENDVAFKATKTIRTNIKCI